MTRYMPRSAWTSTAARGSTLSLPSSGGIAVHWPGTTLARFGVESEAKVAERLRGWRSFHVTGRGWSDIGYTFAVDQAGRVWMLRSTNWAGNLVGAHSASASNPSANRQRVGVLLILGASEQPTAAMIEAFRHWRYTRFLAGWPGRTDLRGHGQVPGASTSCPGPRARALISDGTLARRPASTTTPPPTPPPSTPEDPLMAIKGTEKEVLEKIAAAVARRENPQTGVQLGAAVRITNSSVTDRLSLSDGREQTPRWLWREAWNQAAQGRTAVRDQVIPTLVSIDEKMTALVSAQAGEGTGEIMERIDAHSAQVRQQLEAMADEGEARHAETLDQLEAARAERADILGLVEQVGSGELAADEFVDAVSRRLARPADEDS